MVDFNKKNGDGKINPRDLEKLFDEDFDEEVGTQDPEKIVVDALDPERMAERAKSSQKQVLHELPADYVPPSQPQESEPIVIDKRIVYGVAGLCVLILLSAIIYKVIGSRGGATAGDCDIQLIMGTNIKRNLDSTTWATLSIPSDIQVGDLLKTGSDRRNVIALPDGTTVRMDYNTTIKINSAKNNAKESVDLDITLHKGAVFIDEGHGGSVKVETKYAHIIPIGTRYGVTQVERRDMTEMTVVNVVEGSVRIAHIDDPDSNVIVIAGQQGSATALSLVKPSKAGKDAWMKWNASWRDIRSIPALNVAATKRASSDASSDDSSNKGPGAIKKPEPHQEVGVPSRSSGGSRSSVPRQESQPSYNEPAYHEPIHQSAPPQQHRPGPDARDRDDGSDNGDSQHVNQAEFTADPRKMEENRRREQEARERESRLQAEKAAHEEATRRQREYNAKVKNYTGGTAKEQYEQQSFSEGERYRRTKEIRERNEANDQARMREQKERMKQNEALIAPDDLMPDLKTGNVNGYGNNPHHRIGGNGGQGGGQPRRGMMAPIGESSSMDAKIGESSSMDAKIGESSSMDAKIGESW